MTEAIIIAAIVNVSGIVVGIVTARYAYLARKYSKPTGNGFANDMRESMQAIKTEQLSLREDIKDIRSDASSTRTIMQEQLNVLLAMLLELRKTP